LPSLCSDSGWLAITALLFTNLGPAQLGAMPTGCMVRQGTANSASAQTELHFKVSDNATLDFECFDVADMETVVFEQPSPDSVISIQVSGPHPARILGRVRANGKVVMSCRSGFLVGRDAEITAAGFCGNGEAGAILSHGRLSTRGGAVHLQAQDIAQHGLI